MSIERPDEFKGEFLFRYIKALDYVKDKDVLDIGAGYGEGSKLLSQKANFVLATDNNKKTIKKAEIISTKMSFQYFDAMNSDLGKKFDVITMFEVIEHINPDKINLVLINIKKHLNKNGMVIISTPNKLMSSPNRKKPLNPYHLKEYTPKELKDLLSKHFTILNCFGLKNMNVEYRKKRFNAGNNKINKLISYTGSFMIIRQSFEYIPSSIKNFLKTYITKEDEIIKLDNHLDYELSLDVINSDNLYLICGNL